MEPLLGDPRRIHMRLTSAFGVLALLCCLAGCGDQTRAPHAAAKQSASSTPTTLTCPRGEYVWSEGGLLAPPIADGYATRQAAVQAWLAKAPPRFSRHYVISRDGKVAWLVREDGT